MESEHVDNKTNDTADSSTTDTTAQNTRYFSVEDTSDGCYRDVISALLWRGWKREQTRTKTRKRYILVSIHQPFM
jgi:hypothetical protein